MDKRTLTRWAAGVALFGGSGLAAQAAPAASASTAAPNPASLPAATAATDPATSAGNTEAIARYARYWEERGRFDLARDNWLKLNRLSPDNPQALAGLALAESRSGRNAEAQKYLARLRQTHPADPAIQSIENNIRQGSYDQSKLNQPRALARQGKYVEAVNAYQQAFNGDIPNGRLGLEYYQTLSGTPNGWGVAREGIEKLARENPDDPQFQLGLAQHLTYREETRRDGIQRLQALTDNSVVGVPARQALRQALIWLSPHAGDEAYYRNYQQKFGEDPQVAKKISGKLAPAGAPATATTAGVAGPAVLPAAPAPVIATAAPRSAVVSPTAAPRATPTAVTQGATAARPVPTPTAATAASGSATTRPVTSVAPATTVVPVAPAATVATASSPIVSPVPPRSVRAENAERSERLERERAARQARREREVARTAEPPKTMASDAYTPTPAVQATLPPPATPASRPLILGSEDRGVSTPIVAAAPRMATSYASPAASATAIAPASSPAPVQTVAAQRGALVRQGYELLNNGQPERASALFQQALALPGNDDSDALGGLGIVALRQQDYATSRNYLERASSADPKRASRWREALSTARFWETVRRAEAARRLGDTAAAATYLRRAIDTDPARANAELSVRVSLGDVYAEQGRSAEAEAVYRDVLRRQPGNADAARGLVSVLAATNRTGEALAFADRLPPAVRVQLGNVNALKGQYLRDQADQAVARRDDLRAEGLLKDALLLDPESPWTRLALARLYQRKGRTREAETLLQGLPDTGATAVDTTQVRAEVLADQSRWYDALMELEKIPAGARTPAMYDLQQRLWIRYQTQRASILARSGRTAEAGQILAQLEPMVGDSPEALGAIATGWADIGDSSRALYFMRQALARTGAVDPGLRLQYAFLLFKLQQDAELEVVLEDLLRQPNLTAQQQTDLAGLRIGYRVRQADRLREAGNLARAYDYLAPLLRTNSTDPRVLMALARLYNDSKDFDRTQQLYARVLRIEPNNTDAYKGAIGAALARNRLDDAESLLDQAMRIDGHDPRLFSLAGRLARARGDDARALGYFRQALQLDAEQSGEVQEAPAGANALPRLNLVGTAPVAVSTADTAPGARGFFDPRAGLALRRAAKKTANGIRSSRSDTPPVQVAAAGPGARLRSVAYHPVATPAARLERFYAAYRNWTVVHGRDAKEPVRQTGGVGHGRLIRVSTVDTQGYVYRPTVNSGNAYWDTSRMNGTLRSVPAPAPAVVYVQPVPPPVAYQGPLAEPSLRTEFPNGGVDGQGTTFVAPAAVYQTPSVPVVMSAPASTLPPQYPTPTAPVAVPASPLRREVEADILSIERDGTIVSAPPRGYGRVQGGEYVPDVSPPPATNRAAGRVSPDPLLEPPEFVLARQAPVNDERSQITREIGEIRSRNSSSVGGGILFRTRQGVEGLDRLYDVEAPLEGTVALGETSGRVSLRVIPTYLDAGTVSGSNIPLFGTLALTNRTDLHFNQTASGAAIAAAYDINTFHADIGSTPLGFEIQNVVGGIQWRPQFDRVSLRIDLSRRAVTDSILSYAGVRDPGLGRNWGGVTKNGGRIDASYDFGQVGIYANLGYSVLDGQNVANNNVTEGGAGFYVRGFETPNARLTWGLNLTALGYERNLRHYTWGQGGYFSPQSYLSVAVPVEFAGTYDRLSYRLTGALGFQTFREDGSALYPISPNLQAALNSFIAANPTATVQGGYAGQRQSGVGFNVAALAEYLVSRNVSVGGRVSLDNARNYREGAALGYVRYQFNPQIRVPTAVTPIWANYNYGDPRL